MAQVTICDGSSEEIENELEGTFQGGYSDYDDYNEYQLCEGCTEDIVQEYGL